MQQFESFAQMQRDAERRVMEMQKRAMAAVESSDPPPVIIPNDFVSFSPLPDDAPSGVSQEPEEPKETQTPAAPLLPGLPLTEEDSERALLLATLLLIKDHADPRLLFLLLYLLT